MIFLKKKYGRAKLKFHLMQLMYAFLYWNVAIRFAIFIQSLGYRSIDLSDAFSKGMIFMKDRLLSSSIIISIFALFSWYIQFFIYPMIVRKYHIKRVTIVVVLFDTAVFIFIGVLLAFVHYTVERGLGVFEASEGLVTFMFNSTTLFFLNVMFVGSYVYQLLITLFKQIGYKRLGKVMMGYYQRPREENLIFMFLDLQSSTEFAEKLGHEKYSYFIQDCFKVLTNPLLMTNGRVYQFVGDEVVITWNASKIKNFKKAVDFFFLFCEELKKQRSYFDNKYGIIPGFSASINVGKVMSAEVGEIKTELAFHGDVLNTAARIQKQCKPYEKELLVTKAFANVMLSNQNGYEINFVDKVSLKGIGKEVELFEVRSGDAGCNVKDILNNKQ